MVLVGGSLLEWDDCWGWHHLALYDVQPILVVEVMSVPNRRECQTIKVVIHGTSKASVYLTSSIDLSGASPRLQEVFCSVEKTGSDERAYMDTIARLVSRLLRYESVEEVASCLEGVVTSLRGPVTSPNKVKFCMGFIDLLSKEMVAIQEELEHAQQELQAR